VFFFFINQNIFSQVITSPDALALKIPGPSTNTTKSISDYIKQNFSTDTARARAIYFWITNNISYDVAKLQARNTNTDGVRQSVDDVLKTRSAVCGGYADLFVELCTGVGIKAILVGGYIKKGAIVSPLAHAWVGAQIAGIWYLFDPTWGAGYVRNDQFVKTFNNKFYKVLPEDMIKDHMPFDPMYQFLNHPITNKEFIDGKTAINTAKPFFNYIDTLKQYAMLSPAEKIRNETRRLEANGIQNDLIMERLNHLKKGVNSYAAKDKYDEAGIAFRQATALFEQYIGHKNKQFTTIEDNNLRQIVDSMSYYANLSRSLLVTIVPKVDAQREMLTNTHKNLEKFQNRVMLEKEFVVRYIGSDQTARRQMFGRK